MREALDDLEVFLSGFGMTPEAIFQSLDPQGDGRQPLIWRLGSELRKMEPRSETEAIQMLRLSNRIARVFSSNRARQMEEVLMWRFSLSLLPAIHDEEKLKAETRNEVSGRFYKLGISGAP